MFLLWRGSYTIYLNGLNEVLVENPIAIIHKNMRIKLTKEEDKFTLDEDPLINEKGTEK